MKSCTVHIFPTKSRTVPIFSAKSRSVQILPEKSSTDYANTISELHNANTNENYENQRIVFNNTIIIKLSLFFSHTIKYMSAVNYPSLRSEN